MQLTIGSAFFKRCLSHFAHHFNDEKRTKLKKETSSWAKPETADTLRTSNKIITNKGYSYNAQVQTLRLLGSVGRLLFRCDDATVSDAAMFTILSQTLTAIYN